MAAEPNTLSDTHAADRGEARFARLIGTGMAFVVFGLGALIVGLALLPLVRCLPASARLRRARARGVVSAALRFFVSLTRTLRLAEYRVHGRERLGRPGQLVIANHPSLIDVVFLLAFMPGAGCVVKHGLWRNPVTRNAVKLAEFISNDSAAEMIEGAAQALRDGQTLIMFPEGTRTTPGQPLVFHRGAANIALRAAQVLTPVYVSCRPTTLTKNEPWYRIPARRVQFVFEVGEDVPLDELRKLPSLPIASRALNEQLQDQFRKRLAHL